MRRFWKITKWCGIGVAALLLLTILAALVACLTARLWQKPWVQPMPEISLAPKLPIIREADVKPDSGFARLHDAMKMVVSEKDILGDSKTRAEAIIDAAHDTGEIDDPLAAALHQCVNEIAKKSIYLQVSEETQRLNFTRYSDAQFPLSTFLLIQNRDALAALFKIAQPLKAPDFEIAVSENSFEEANASKLPTTINLILISATREASIGDSVGAFNQLNAALKMTRTMMTGKALVGKLIEYAEAQKVLVTMRDLTETYDVPPSLLQDETSWLATWQTEQPYDLMEALKVENIFTKKLLHKFFRDPIAYAKHDWLSEDSPNFVAAQFWIKTHLSRLMGYSEKMVVSDEEAEKQNMIALVQQPYERQKLADCVARFHANGFAILKMRDPLGYWLSAQSLMTISAIYYRDLQNRFEIEATRAMLAIRAFKQTERKLPESLDALVPKVLPAVPRDPFLENAPLHFRANADGTWIVYSVGADQIDDGGSEPKNGKYIPSLTAKGDLVMHSDEAARSKTRYEKHNSATTR